MKIQFLLFASILCLLPFTLRAEDKVTDAAPRTAFDVPKTTPSTNEFFAFSGGRLDKFIEEVRKTYGVDMNAIGTIPQINDLQIPKMRLKRLPGQNFTTALNLYNDISEESGLSLGKWVIKYQHVNGSDLVSALVLTPPPSRSAKLSNVKAFSVKSLKDGELDLLRNAIQNAGYGLRESGSDVIKGQVDYHPPTHLVVVTGSPEYVNLASTMITAYLQGRTNSSSSDKKE